MKYIYYTPRQIPPCHRAFHQHLRSGSFSRASSLALRHRTLPGRCALACGSGGRAEVVSGGGAQARRFIKHWVRCPSLCASLAAGQLAAEADSVETDR